VRDIAALAALGEAAGVPLIEATAMPANNFTLTFERA
jgi:hypothetical protein